MSQLNKHSILIVDDTPANLAVAVAMLEQHGLRVSVAQGGVEALRRVALAPPDLILLDVMLPDLDGFEVCRRLKIAESAVARVPVIFMTALTSTADKVAGFGAGAVDYLTKPLQVEEVLARVAMHLRLADMQARLTEQNALLEQARDSLEQQVAARTAELRESERQFRTLSENLPDPIVRYDRELRRVYANPAYLRAQQVTAAQALGPMRTEAWNADLPLAHYHATLRQVLADGRPAEVDLSMSDADDGAVRHWAIRMVAEQGEDGGNVGVLAIARDVTQQKRAELQLAQSHAQLRELGAHRESAREDERKHIARELHDELGQSLTALRMTAALLRVRFGAQLPELNQHVRSMTELVDRTIGVVRNVATSLRPAALDLGIGSALEWLVEEFRKHSAVSCRLTLVMNGYELSEQQGVAVFRIVQESLTNIARHAGASEAVVLLRCREPECQLQVSDNGRGFDPAVQRAASFGLLGIRERVLTLGGELSIISHPGAGTRISASIPLDDEPDDNNKIIRDES
jgi:PAS domain S-box-containing protein